MNIKVNIRTADRMIIVRNELRIAMKYHPKTHPTYKAAKQMLAYYS